MDNRIKKKKERNKQTNEKLENKFGSYQEAEKAVEHEGNGNINYKWCFWNDSKRLGKKNWGNCKSVRIKTILTTALLRSARILSRVLEAWGGPRRPSVTHSSVKDLQLTLVWKIRWEWNHNTNITADINLHHTHIHTHIHTCSNTQIPYTNTYVHTDTHIEILVCDISQNTKNLHYVSRKKYGGVTL